MQKCIRENKVKGIGGATAAKAEIVDLEGGRSTYLHQACFANAIAFTCILKISRMCPRYWKVIR
jgi:hypothetical protein